MVNKKIIFVTILLLTVIAFFLRVLPFNYGSSTSFMDTHLFGQALNLGKLIVERDFSQLKTLANYPYFFSYIFLFFFGIFYLIGAMAGLFSSSADFIKYIILQMDQMFELSRIIVAISGALLVPLVYMVTKRLIAAKVSRKQNKWIIIGSLLAAILMTFSLLHVHFGKLVRPHIPVSFLLFLSFYIYLILLKKKNFLSYAALGLVSGATAGTLQNGFLSILFLILGHLFLIYQNYKEKNQKISIRLKEVFSWQFIIALIIFFLVVIISYPYVFLSPKEALNLENGQFSLILGGGWGMEYVGGLANFRGGGFVTEIEALCFYEPGLILTLLFLSVVYFVFWKVKIKSKKTQKKSLYYCLGLWGAILFIFFYFVLFGIYNHTGYRMLTPLIPFLCMATGIIAFLVLDKSTKKYRYLIIAFIVIILIFPMVQSFRLTALALRGSTQDLAADWIKKNIAPNKIIAIGSESRIRLDSSQESLKKRIDLLGPDSIGQRDQFLLSLNEKDYPKDAMAVFPLFTFKEDYDKIYDFLKTETDYLVLGRFAIKPGISPSPDPMYKISTSLNKTLIKTFIPFKEDSSNRESRFPQEIKNPVIDLWAYKRMGAVIEIYKINH